MENEDKISKAEYIKYLRLILRRMGHLTPKSGWLETYSYPGIQLSSLCRHCKRIFAICGYANSSDMAEVNNYNSAWMLMEILSIDNTTNRAWSSSRNSIEIKKNTITTLGLIDFKSPSKIYNFLFSLTNGKMPAPKEEPLDVNKVIKEKLDRIDNQFYCDKVKSWI